jgi:hypothetical protein
MKIVFEETDIALFSSLHLEGTKRKTLLAPEFRQNNR